MDIRQLVYFAHAAKTNHISRSAMDLNISQPSLTLSIRHLEAELGVQLFDRRGRSVALNDYGRILLHHVEPILSQWEQALIELEKAQTVANSRISIIAPPNIYAQLPPLIKKYLPEVTIIKHPICPVSELSDRMRSHQVDICIQSIPPSLPPALSCTELWREERVLLMQPVCQIGTGSTAKLSDYAGFPFVSYSPNSSNSAFLHDVCRRAGFEVNVAATGNDLFEIIEVLKISPYIALVPRHVIKSYQTEGLVKLYITDVDSTMPVGIYHLADHPERPIVTHLRNLIIENFSIPPKK